MRIATPPAARQKPNLRPWAARHCRSRDAESERRFERFAVRTQLPLLQTGGASFPAYSLPVRAPLTVPSILIGLAAALPKVTLLADVDALSHSSGDVSVADAILGSELARAVSAASQLGTVVRRRLASSSVTARTHLGLLVGTPNNVWAVRYGLDGADAELIEELGAAAARGGQNAVVLVGADHAYADAVESLRDQGVPTWLLSPSRARLSSRLRAAATAVSVL